MSRTFKIGERTVGGDNPCYIIAEVSCNHEGDFDEARRIIEEAAKAGADAAKIQTYTPSTMTGNFQNRAEGTMWSEIDLFKLYEKAQTPWEWHGDLLKVAEDNGIHLFSSPFDETAVDHLMQYDVPVFKIASFELVDTKLLEKVASTGKPVIISNGMTDYLELDEAVRTLRNHGVQDLAVLHCNSGYPASFDEANVNTVPVIGELFDVVPGISDHTIYADDRNYKAPMAHVTPLEAVKKGAKIVEVHLLLDREKARALNENDEGGFDWPFSREPAELKKMVDMIREYEDTGGVDYETQEEKIAAARTHGDVCFEPTPKELSSRALRPCLWVVKDIAAGEVFHFAPAGEGNIDSLRPTGGMPIRFADFIQGKHAKTDISAGQPLQWNMVKI